MALCLSWTRYSEQQSSEEHELSVLIISRSSVRTHGVSMLRQADAIALLSLPELTRMF